MEIASISTGDKEHDDQHADLIAIIKLYHEAYNRDHDQAFLYKTLIAFRSAFKKHCDQYPNDHDHQNVDHIINDFIDHLDAIYYLARLMINHSKIDVRQQEVIAC